MQGPSCLFTLVPSLRLRGHTLRCPSQVGILLETHSIPKGAVASRVSFARLVSPEVPHRGASREARGGAEGVPFQKRVADAGGVSGLNFLAGSLHVGRCLVQIHLSPNLGLGKARLD